MYACVLHYFDAASYCLQQKAGSVRKRIPDFDRESGGRKAQKRRY